MNRILVIGGTGNVGRQVVYQLAATGARFRAMARNPDAAGLPPQVEVVRGDLTVPETLDRCLQDIDAVFLVWVAPPTGVCDIHVCGAHRSGATDLPRMGHRPRRGIPGIPGIDDNSWRPVRHVKNSRPVLTYPRAPRVRVRCRLFMGWLLRIERPIAINPTRLARSETQPASTVPTT
jgi:hypothetical protein